MTASASIIVAMSSPLARAIQRVVATVLGREVWAGSQHCDGLTPSFHVILGPGSDEGPSYWFEFARDSGKPAAIFLLPGTLETLGPGYWHGFFTEDLTFGRKDRLLADMLAWLVKNPAEPHPLAPMMRFIGGRTFLHKLGHVLRFCCEGHFEHLAYDDGEQIEQFCLAWRELEFGQSRQPVDEMREAPLGRFLEVLREEMNGDHGGPSGIQLLDEAGRAYSRWAESPEEESRRLALKMTAARALPVAEKLRAEREKGEFATTQASGCEGRGR